MAIDRRIPVIVVAGMLALAAAGCSGLSSSTINGSGHAGGSAPVGGSTHSTGSGQHSADAAVRRSATSLINTTSAKLTCTELLTTRLVKEIYKTPARCLAAPITSDSTATSSVAGIVVHGSSAQVAVTTTEHGRTARGHIAYVEQSGQWRADRYEDDFVRASLTASVEQPQTSGLFSSAAERSCMVKKIPSISITSLRTFLYASIRNDPAARHDAIEFAAACPKPLSAFVASRLMDAVSKQGRTPAQLRCIETTMAQILPVTGLEKKALEAHVGSAVSAALAGLISGAEKSCK